MIGEVSAATSRVPNARCQRMPLPSIISFASVIRFLSSRMVAFMSRKSESKTEIAAVPGQVQRLAVFGPPLLLEGEDAAAYDELLARVCAAVKPADIIDEMFIADIVALEWEVLRWRRLKWTLMQETGLEALKLFLVHNSSRITTRNTLRVISRQFSKTIFRPSKRALRGRWRPNVPRIMRKLTKSSMRSSAAWAWR